MELDGIDKKILLLLQENSRTKNVEIAEKVNLTEGAIRNRIERLVKGKIINKFTIETVSENEFYGIVLLKAKSDTKKMMKEVSALHVANNAFEISGEFDGCIIINAPSLSKLDAKIDEIRKCSQVVETRTFIVVKKW